MKNEFCQHCTGRIACEIVEAWTKGMQVLQDSIILITRSPGFKTALRIMNELNKELKKGGK